MCLEINCTVDPRDIKVKVIAGHSKFGGLKVDGPSACLQKVDTCQCGTANIHIIMHTIDEVAVDTHNPQAVVISTHTYRRSQNKITRTRLSLI